MARWDVAVRAIEGGVVDALVDEWAETFPMGSDADAEVVGRLLDALALVIDERPPLDEIVRSGPKGLRLYDEDHPIWHAIGHRADALKGMS